MPRRATRRTRRNTKEESGSSAVSSGNEDEEVADGQAKDAAPATRASNRNRKRKPASRPTASVPTRGSKRTRRRPSNEEEPTKSDEDDAKSSDEEQSDNPDDQPSKKRVRSNAKPSKSSKTKKLPVGRSTRSSRNNSPVSSEGEGEDSNDEAASSESDDGREEKKGTRTRGRAGRGAKSKNKQEDMDIEKEDKEESSPVKTRATRRAAKSGKGANSKALKSEPSSGDKEGSSDADDESETEPSESVKPTQGRGRRKNAAKTTKEDDGNDDDDVASAKSQSDDSEASSGDDDDNDDGRSETKSSKAQKPHQGTAKTSKEHEDDTASKEDNVEEARPPPRRGRSRKAAESQAPDADDVESNDNDDSSDDDGTNDDRKERKPSAMARGQIRKMKAASDSDSKGESNKSDSKSVSDDAKSVESDDKIQVEKISDAKGSLNSKKRDPTPSPSKIDSEEENYGSTSDVQIKLRDTSIDEAGTASNEVGRHQKPGSPLDSKVEDKANGAMDEPEKAIAKSKDKELPGNTTAEGRGVLAKNDKAASDSQEGNDELGSSENDVMSGLKPDHPKARTASNTTPSRESKDGEAEASLEAKNEEKSENHEDDNSKTAKVSDDVGEAAPRPLHVDTSIRPATTAHEEESKKTGGGLDDDSSSDEELPLSKLKDAMEKRASGTKKVVPADKVEADVVSTDKKEIFGQGRDPLNNGSKDTSNRVDNDASNVMQTPASITPSVNPIAAGGLKEGSRSNEYPVSGEGTVQQGNKAPNHSDRIVVQEGIQPPSQTHIKEADIEQCGSPTETLPMKETKETHVSTGDESPPHQDAERNPQNKVLAEKSTLVLTQAVDKDDAPAQKSEVHAAALQDVKVRGRIENREAPSRTPGGAPRPSTAATFANTTSENLSKGKEGELVPQLAGDTSLVVSKVLEKDKNDADSDKVILGGTEEQEKIEVSLKKPKAEDGDLNPPTIPAARLKNEKTKSESAVQPMNIDPKVNAMKNPHDIQYRPAENSLRTNTQATIPRVKPSDNGAAVEAETSKATIATMDGIGNDSGMTSDSRIVPPVIHPIAAQTTMPGKANSYVEIGALSTSNPSRSHVPNFSSSTPVEGTMHAKTAPSPGLLVNLAKELPVSSKPGQLPQTEGAQAGVASTETAAEPERTNVLKDQARVVNVRNIETRTGPGIAVNSPDLQKTTAVPVQLVEKGSATKATATSKGAMEVLASPSHPQTHGMGDDTPLSEIAKGAKLEESVAGQKRIESADTKPNGKVDDHGNDLSKEVQAEISFDIPTVTPIPREIEPAQEAGILMPDDTVPEISKSLRDYYLHLESKKENSLAFKGLPSSSEFSETLSLRILPSESKLGRIKALLYAEGNRAHSGHSFERIFNDYWDALCLIISDRLFKPTHEKCSISIKAFLKTKRLRRLHNKLVLSLLASSKETMVSTARIPIGLPKSLRKQIKTVGIRQPSHNPVSRVLEESPAESYKSSGEISIYREAWSSSERQSSENSGENSVLVPRLNGDITAENIARRGPSSSVPGALAIDPFVRKAAQAQGVRVTENAVWLLVVAMKEHSKSFLKRVVDEKKASEMGKIGRHENPYRNVAKCNQKGIGSRVDEAKHKKAAIVPKTEPAKKRKCITTFDVLSAISSNCTPATGSVGDPASRSSFESALRSVYDSNPVPLTSSFRAVHKKLTSDLEASSKSRRPDPSRFALLASPPPKATSPPPSTGKVIASETKNLMSSPTSVGGGTPLQSPPPMIQRTMPGSSPPQASSETQERQHGVQADPLPKQSAETTEAVQNRGAGNVGGSGAKDLAALKSRADKSDDPDKESPSKASVPGGTGEEDESGRPAKGVGNKNLAAMRARISNKEDDEKDGNVVQSSTGEGEQPPKEEDGPKTATA